MAGGGIRNDSHYRSGLFRMILVWTEIYFHFIDLDQGFLLTCIDYYAKLITWKLHGEGC